ncbi:hypothetical protein [Bacillus sp. USDA818B3_A]|uniref:hypothetical protein n=1 Tax=Bacillus sp. USDA818B3_A TaxID=2698834 RepID=UPI001F18E6DF|nr:hypothetical protein [Bacillus sp. USDA818B3_A]
MKKNRSFEAEVLAEENGQRHSLGVYQFMYPLDNSYLPQNGRILPLQFFTFA